MSTIKLQGESPIHTLYIEVNSHIWNEFTIYLSKIILSDYIVPRLMELCTHQTLQLLKHSVEL